MKRFYQAIVAVLLVAMLTNVAVAAKDDIFVGSTDLAKDIYQGLNDTRATFIIDSVPNRDTLKEAMLEALAQNPYAGHATGWRNQPRSAQGYMEITPDYVLKEDVRKKQKTELQKKVKSAVKKIIKDGMTTEQKVDAIQRYIAANCEYDRDTLQMIIDGTGAETKRSERFTAYGALVDGKAVCQGYANAFKALADEAGIRNVIIFGETNNGIPHSWNRVYDNKKWYTVDTSNLDLNMWQQTSAYVASATVKARLVVSKQTIVDSQWKTLFG